MKSQARGRKDTAKKARPSRRRAKPVEARAASPARREQSAPPRGRLNRPARIGVLSPAGKVVSHDEVLTHSHGDADRSIRQFTNIGDAFVYDSSLKILDFAELVPVYVPEGEADLAAHVEQIDSLDYVFLRGSNYINTNGKWDHITPVLEKTKVPIIAFGIGVQAPDTAEVFVNESTKRFLQLIADRSVTVGVRGQLSKKALATIGIRNVRIIGCPTAFRSRQPEIRLQRVDADGIERLGFTLRRKTHGRAMLQRYLMRSLSAEFPTTIFCAGELEEKAIYYAGRGLVSDPDATMTAAVNALVSEDWLFGQNDPLLGLYLSSLAVFESVGEFEAEIRTMSAVTGFRLHGNLLALATGVPALYVTYDSRTREFVETLGIPFVESRLMDRFSFRRAWEKADFDRFERTYAERFGDLVAFLDENNMPHRLGIPRDEEVLDAAE